MNTFIYIQRFLFPLEQAVSSMCTKKWKVNLMWKLSIIDLHSVAFFFQYIWIWWSNSFPAAGRLAFWTKDWKLSDICRFSTFSTASWGIAKLKTEGSCLNSSSLKHFHIYPHSNYAHCEWCFCSSSLFFVWTVTVVTVKVNKHLCSFSFWILLSGGLGRGSSDLPRILQIFCLSDSIYLTGCSYTSPEWIANS